MKAIIAFVAVVFMAGSAMAVPLNLHDRDNSGHHNESNSH